jgi:hypothetical protein
MSMTWAAAATNIPCGRADRAQPQVNAKITSPRPLPLVMVLDNANGAQLRPVLAPASSKKRFG